jgi:hypothetical protein
MATPPAILVSTLLTRITPPSINGRVGRQRRTGAPALYRMPPGTSWGPTYKRGAPPILGVSPMAWFIAQSGPRIWCSISKIECITTFSSDFRPKRHRPREPARFASGGPAGRKFQAVVPIGDPRGGDFRFGEPQSAPWWLLRLRNGRGGRRQQIYCHLVL